MASLKDLPFDQYSRQKIVADGISTLRNKDQCLNILDVGGYKGQTQKFSKEDKVTVLDVFDVQEPEYIKGDGTNMHLKDNSFDIVVSFDVLEHIPAASRKKFIEECVRVSKSGFFLGCPFESGTGLATKAEKNLSGMYKKFTGKDHRWLGEHIENGLPTTDKIEKVLADNNLNFCRMYSNRLDNWITLQTLFFLSGALDVVSMEAGKLNRYYNERLNTMESGIAANQSYRVIYFVSQEKAMVSKVEKLFAEFDKVVGPESTTLFDQLPEAVSEIVKQKVDTQHDTMQHQINLLTAQTASLEQTINNMRGTVSWKVTKPLRAGKYLKRKRS